MECVQAWEHIELPFEYALLADVTHLLRVDGDVLVPLLPLFLSELLGTLGVLSELLLQILDL